MDAVRKLTVGMNENQNIYVINIVVCVFCAVQWQNKEHTAYPDMQDYTEFS